MKVMASLPYLRAFEAVARLGTVRAAAIELHVTPGAVSQQIRILQDRLGLELFTRQGRRLRLSKAGQALRQAAAVAFGELATCIDSLDPRAGVQASRGLTVSVPPALGMSWLTGLVFDFGEAAGLASFRMLPATGMDDVDWRVTDVAVVYGNPPWPGYWWRLIANITLRPVCSPRLLNGPKALRRPEDVCDQCLLHEDAGSEWQRWLAAAQVRRPAARHAHFGTLMLALAAALDGRGIALVSDFLVQEHLRDGRLVRPFDIGIEAAKSYYVACHESRANDPLVARFADWVIERRG